MTHLYRASADHPAHISVGAILMNDEGKILCHYFKKSPWREADNLYLLMRETLENGETLEDTVHRGLKEEFGATGEIKEYIGSIVSSNFDFNLGRQIEKTTLYFLVHLLSFDPKLRDQNDSESLSELVWLTPEELISYSEKQGYQLNRTDLDEASILKRLSN